MNLPPAGRIAIHRIAESVGEEVADWILPDLFSEFPIVRSSAREACRKLKLKKAVPLLINFIEKAKNKNEYFEDCLDAIETLGEIKGGAEELKAMYASFSDPLLRAETLQAIYNIERDLAFVTEKLNDAPQVVCKALTLLGPHCKIDSIKPYLYKSDITASAAIQALADCANIDSRLILKSLYFNFKKLGPLSKTALIKSYIKLEIDESIIINLLIQALEKEENWTRSQALQILVENIHKFRHPHRVLEHTVKLLPDFSEKIKQIFTVWNSSKKDQERVEEFIKYKILSTVNELQKNAFFEGWLDEILLNMPSRELPLFTKMLIAALQYPADEVPEELKKNLLLFLINSGFKEQLKHILNLVNKKILSERKRVILMLETALKRSKTLKRLKNLLEIGNIINLNYKDLQTIKEWTEDGRFTLFSELLSLAVKENLRWAIQAAFKHFWGTPQFLQIVSESKIAVTEAVKKLATCKTEKNFGVQLLVLLNSLQIDITNLEETLWVIVNNSEHDILVRAKAAYILAKNLPEEKISPLLLKTETGIKEATLRALIEANKGGKLKKMLWQLHFDPEFSVRMEATILLLKLKENVEENLLNMLEIKNPEKRYQILLRLSEISVSPLFSLKLVFLLNDENFAITQKVAELLKAAAKTHRQKVIEAVSQVIKRTEIPAHIESTTMDTYYKHAYVDTLSVMFVDIVGYTQKSSKLPLFEIGHLVSEFEKITREPIRKHNGKVVKTIGDAILATFTDAKDAVDAALEILSRIRTYNLYKLPEERMEVRIGINTGPVWIKEGDVFGDTVNVAARIQAKAPPGGVLITKETFEQVKNHFECHPLLPIHVKGKAEPIEVFTVGEKGRSISVPDAFQTVFQNFKENIIQFFDPRLRPKLENLFENFFSQLMELRLEMEKSKSV